MFLAGLLKTRPLGLPRRALLLCGVSLPLSAAPLDMTDYVADAINAHPQVKEQVHIYRQVRQDLDIARSGWRPSVDLFATAGRTEGETPTIVGTQQNDFSSDRAELSVTQNLFNGFDTVNQVKQNDARLNSALFDLYDAADNIALDAVRAYLDVMKQQRLLVLAEENVASHEETLEKVKRRSGSGAGRRSQLEQTEGRVARARASLVAQRNNLYDSLTEAHQILGRYITPEQLQEPALPKRPGENLDALIESALEQHPAMLVASHNIEAAQHDYERTKSKYYPKLDLRLAQEVGNDLNGIPGQTDETSIALNLEYNLYNGGADQALQRKKISAVHEQQQFAARVRRQIINTLRLAWMADESLTEQLAFLREHVIQSRKTTISYQEEFFIGQRDLIDLLDAKNELNSAQNRYTEAYYDALIARYRLYEGVGKLFGVVGLAPQLSEDDLKVGRIETAGLDELPLNADTDADQQPDVLDHCDNSPEQSSVNRYGCQAQ